VTRWLIASAGVLAGGYGGWLLLFRQDPADLLDVGVWLVSGVLLHDIVLSAAALLAGLGVALLPRPARAPAAVALIVVAALTIVAFPALGNFGEVPENPTHLDRSYVASWVVLVLLVVAAVVVASIARARRREE
jgi:hypothetical protein